ncbi:MAG: hypothetical protein AAGU21_07900 [Solidesulfovibrio sp.]|uniref:hypothetical protein n=1 Tax=Solidesulfovibrio sp. TaxID=2910990 RepID=UPI003158E67F
MAAKTDALPPLLPVIPEYVPWLDKARDEAAADAAFAGRQGAMTAGTAGATPENPRGGIADETA